MCKVLEPVCSSLQRGDIDVFPLHNELLRFYRVSDAFTVLHTLVCIFHPSKIIEHAKYIHQLLQQIFISLQRDDIDVCPSRTELLCSVSNLHVYTQGGGKGGGSVQIILK